MSEIQQARAVLAKWRDGTTEGPWEDRGNYIAAPGYVVASTIPGDNALIVGTAGNPDLLDAIDKVMADASGALPATQFYAHILATAIIAADERMTP